MGGFLAFINTEKRRTSKASDLMSALAKCELTLTFRYVYGTAQLQSLESRVRNLLEYESLQLREVDETGAGQGDGFTAHWLPTTVTLKNTNQVEIRIWVKWSIINSSVHKVNSGF